jgi:arginyl-tRNA synthetase
MPFLVHAVPKLVHELAYNASFGSLRYVSKTSGAGKNVVVEYSSPKIAKSPHVGHLRPIIIGTFLAKLYMA